MLRALNGAREWLRPDTPRSRLDAIRALVGLFAFLYLLVRFRYFADYARHAPSELVPIGIAGLLSAPLPPFATWTIAFVTLVAAAVFTARGRLGPLLFFGLLWVTTYRSSFGKILHSENLLVVHVGILAFARPRTGRERGFVRRLLAIATTLTYFVAGITKLRTGGAAWITGTALGDWLAFDALRKIELGSVHSPLAPMIANAPAVLGFLSILTLVVEIGAPLALFSRRGGRVWAASAWGFHVAVLATMAIGFFYPLSGVAFAAFLPVERLPILRRLTAR